MVRPKFVCFPKSSLIQNNFSQKSEMVQKIYFSYKLLLICYITYKPNLCVSEHDMRFILNNTLHQEKYNQHWM